MSNHLRGSIYAKYFVIFLHLNDLYLFFLFYFFYVWFFFITISSFHFFCFLLYSFFSLFFSIFFYRDISFSPRISIARENSKIEDDIRVKKKRRHLRSEVIYLRSFVCGIGWLIDGVVEINSLSKKSERILLSGIVNFLHLVNQQGNDLSSNVTVI